MSEETFYICEFQSSGHDSLLVKAVGSRFERKIFDVLDDLFGGVGGVALTDSTGVVLIDYETSEGSEISLKCVPQSHIF